MEKPSVAGGEAASLSPVRWALGPASAQPGPTASGGRWTARTAWPARPAPPGLGVVRPAARAPAGGPWLAAAAPAARLPRGAAPPPRTPGPVTVTGVKA